MDIMELQRTRTMSTEVLSDQNNALVAPVVNMDTVVASDTVMESGALAASKCDTMPAPFNSEGEDINCHTKEVTEYADNSISTKEVSFDESEYLCRYTPDEATSPAEVETPGEAGIHDEIDTVEVEAPSQDETPAEVESSVDVETTPYEVSVATSIEMPGESSISGDLITQKSECAVKEQKCAELAAQTSDATAEFGEVTKQASENSEVADSRNGVSDSRDSEQSAPRDSETVQSTEQNVQGQDKQAELGDNKTGPPKSKKKVVSKSQKKKMRQAQEQEQQVIGTWSTPFRKGKDAGSSDVTRTPGSDITRSPSDTRSPEGVKRQIESDAESDGIRPSSSSSSTSFRAGKSYGNTHYSSPIGNDISSKSSRSSASLKPRATTLTSNSRNPNSRGMRGEEDLTLHEEFLKSILTQAERAKKPLDPRQSLNVGRLNERNLVESLESLKKGSNVSNVSNTNKATVTSSFSTAGSSLRSNPRKQPETVESQAEKVKLQSDMTNPKMTKKVSKTSQTVPNAPQTGAKASGSRSKISEKKAQTAEKEQKKKDYVKDCVLPGLLPHVGIKNSSMVPPIKMWIGTTAKEVEAIIASRMSEDDMTPATRTPVMRSPATRALVMLNKDEASAQTSDETQRPTAHEEKIRDNLPKKNGECVQDEKNETTNDTHERTNDGTWFSKMTGTFKAIVSTLGTIADTLLVDVDDESGKASIGITTIDEDGLDTDALQETLAVLGNRGHNPGNIGDRSLIKSDEPPRSARRRGMFGPYGDDFHDDPYGDFDDEFDPYDDLYGDDMYGFDDDMMDDMMRRDMMEDMRRDLMMGGMDSIDDGLGRFPGDFPFNEPQNEEEERQYEEMYRAMIFREMMMRAEEEQKGKEKVSSGQKGTGRRGASMGGSMFYDESDDDDTVILKRPQAGGARAGGKATQALTKVSQANSGSGKAGGKLGSPDNMTEEETRNMLLELLGGIAKGEAKPSKPVTTAVKSTIIGESNSKSLSTTAKTLKFDLKPSTTTPKSTTSAGAIIGNAQSTGGKAESNTVGKKQTCMRKKSKVRAGVSNIVKKTTEQKKLLEKEDLESKTDQLQGILGGQKSTTKISSTSTASKSFRINDNPEIYPMYADDDDDKIPSDSEDRTREFLARLGQNEMSSEELNEQRKLEYEMMKRGRGVVSGNSSERGMTEMQMDDKMDEEEMQYMMQRGMMDPYGDYDPYDDFDYPFMGMDDHFDPFEDDLEDINEDLPIEELKKEGAAIVKKRKEATTSWKPDSLIEEAEQLLEKNKYREALATVSGWQQCKEETSYEATMDEEKSYSHAIAIMMISAYQLGDRDRAEELSGIPIMINKVDAAIKRRYEGTKEVLVFIPEFLEMCRRARDAENAKGGGEGRGGGSPGGQGPAGGRAMRAHAAARGTTAATAGGRGIGAKPSSRVGGSRTAANRKNRKR